MSLSASSALPQLPTGKTKFAGLFGWPVKNSLSPALHTRWFAEAGLNAMYLPFAVQQQQHFLDFAATLQRVENFLGGNITIPFKRAVLELPNVVPSDCVRACSAANTLYFHHKKNHWALENTDVAGVLASLRFFNFAPDNCVFIVLGAGGAAAAALEACRMFSGTLDRCWIMARNPQKALQQLSNFFPQEMPEGVSGVCLPTVSEFTLKSGERLLSSKLVPIVVNTLPLGHAGEPNVHAQQLLLDLKTKGLVGAYFDMVYANTPALEFATDQGFVTLNGKLMLETQARASFELWQTSMMP